MVTGDVVPIGCQGPCGTSAVSSTQPCQLPSQLSTAPAPATETRSFGKSFPDTTLIRNRLVALISGYESSPTLTRTSTLEPTSLGEGVQLKSPDSSPKVDPFGPPTNVNRSRSGGA